MRRLTDTKGWREHQLPALSADEVAKREDPGSAFCVNECVSPSSVIMMVSH